MRTKNWDFISPEFIPVPEEYTVRARVGKYDLYIAGIYSGAGGMILSWKLIVKPEVMNGSTKRLRLFDWSPL